MKLKLLTVFALISIPLAALYGAVVKDFNNKKNICVPIIEGKWTLNTEVSKLISSKEAFIDELEFTIDEAAIPEKVLEKLPAKMDWKIYCIGYVTIKRGEKIRFDKAPFFLTDLGGCPHIVFYLERKGDPFGNAESFYISVVKAEDSKKDMLFVGGDHPGETFRAYTRAGN